MALVPKMALHVFAENAVKHGIFHLKERGKLEIRIRKEEASLVIEIEDNVIGREASRNMKYDKTGKGLILMKEFFQVYKTYYNEDISFQIIDLKSQENKSTGTLIRITIENFEVQKLV